jgi:hypothetical protein
VSWRNWLIAAVFGAWLVFIAVRSLMPWTWVGHYTTPSGHTGSVTYHCGSIWRANSVSGPTEIPYALNGEPCGNRGDMQVASFIDVAVGLGGLTGVVWWRRRQAADPETAFV